jgi:hypothetical protein
VFHPIQLSEIFSREGVSLYTVNISWVLGVVQLSEIFSREGVSLYTVNISWVLGVVVVTAPPPHGKGLRIAKFQLPWSHKEAIWRVFHPIQLSEIFSREGVSLYTLNISWVLGVVVVTVPPNEISAALVP